VNNLSIVGRIGKVGDLRYTQSGKAVINLSVAVDNGKDANGEKRKSTWFEVALWEKQAEALAEYLVVGDRIGINGQIRLQVDEGNDGKQYPKLTVDFPRVELLGGSSKPEQTQQANRAPAQRQAARPAQQTGRPAQRQAAPAAVADPDDIPF
jgi:single-strand DNA-binding protein